MTDYGHDLLFGSFVTPTAADPQRVVALTRLAEQAGLDLATFQDHPYQPAFLDTWTLMSYLAAATERIRLTANVLNLPLRPPVVLARSAASLDLLSGGRVELGLGAGAFWDAIEAAGGRRLSPGQAVEALDEAIRVIRGVWAADERGGVRVEGTHHHVVGAKRGPAPAHDIGIWVGAYKPRMLALTGRSADGWLPSLGYLPGGPADLDGMNRIIDDAAVSAGRDPSAVRRLLNVSGRFTAAGGGLLSGPPKQWADELADLALRYGISGFVLATDDPHDLAAFGAEVAPAVREQVADERRGTPTAHLGPDPSPAAVTGSQPSAAPATGTTSTGTTSTGTGSTGSGSAGTSPTDTNPTGTGPTTIGSTATGSTATGSTATGSTATGSTATGSTGSAGGRAAGSDRSAVALRVTPTPAPASRLSRREVWDETTRPTAPPAPAGHVYGPRAQAAGQHLVDVHDHLRAELTELRDALEQVRAGTLDAGAARSAINEMTMRQNDWTLGAYCATYCRTVTTHHSLEDAQIFPHLRRADAGLAPVIDRLEREHVAIHDVLEGVDRALVRFVSTPGDFSGIQEAMDLLTDALLSHLAYEEQQIVEPLARLGFYAGQL